MATEAVTELLTAVVAPVVAVVTVGVSGLVGITFGAKIWKVAQGIVQTRNLEETVDQAGK